MLVNPWKTFSRVPATLAMPDFFLAGLGAGARVLDAGCGPAAAARDIELAGARYTGLDLNAPSLTQVRAEHPDLELVLGDAGRLPFGDNSFDLVVLRAVLTTVPLAKARERILAEAVRVSRNRVGVYDFLQTWEDPLYAARYRAGEADGLERGGFLVLDADKVLFAARHFTRDEVEGLCVGAGAAVAGYEEGPARTRSGNLIRGIALLASVPGERP